ncbi:hypothetical protein OESDEN_16897 [Oesophagostomum dentatum]|uniref:Uncharacterized protein n=1 Tax=Oesophagostomum dentatum TaxID=61180 RepID=A0A0B1SHN0_OESDE|nr:hypothetical protein OESDEN_16897 [Oesophagostomum dentatum]
MAHPLSPDRSLSDNDVGFWTGALIQPGRNWPIPIAHRTIRAEHVVASFLRVESGHQRILIDGRDPYVGFFTHIQFNELTCISAVNIHCLKPLTGAEEIDILYSECERDHWKVAHYTNTKEKFTFRNVGID